MEGDFQEKLGVYLLLLGLIIGTIGAVVTFFLANWLVAVFYLGFFLAIIGFAIAVLYRIQKKPQK